MSYGANVVVFGNVKGGVTKSTTTLTVGIMLHLLGARVLVVDCDPQGNTTDGLGYTPDALEHTIYSLMMGKSTLEQAVKHTYFDATTGIFFDPSDQEELARLQTAQQEKRAVRGPDLLACNIAASAAENELVNHPSWGSLLGRALEGARSRYDFIVADTNPGLGKMTINCFLCANQIVIPSVPERWPTSGIMLLAGAIANAHLMNPALQVAGVLFTRVRYAEHRRHMDYFQREVLPQVNRSFPWMNLSCFESYINESVNFSRTVNERSNIVLALSTDAISLMYWAFLAELLRKMQSPYFDGAVKMYQQQYGLYKEEQTRLAGKKQKRAEVVEEKS